MRRISRDDAIALIDDDATRTTDCVMCGTARGDRPSWHRVGESTHAVAVLDRLATSRGHCIVIAKRHVERVGAFSPEEWLDLQRLVLGVTARIESALEPTRVYVASLGSPTALRTTFPHVHVHLVPIYGNEDRWRPARVFTWQEGVWVYDDSEADALADALRLPNGAGEA